MTDTGPEWLQIARSEIGTKEIPGARSNPEVVQYYIDAIGAARSDDVPWCAAFIGSCLAKAGRVPSGSLMARSYLTWGRRLEEPIPGAIVVFARGRAPNGHVAFVEQADGEDLIVIGGNQSDAVTRERRSRDGVLGYRWPTAKSGKEHT